MKKSITTFTGEKITVGDIITFYDLWDGNGDGEELFETGCIWVANDENDYNSPIVVEYDVIEYNATNILKSKIKIVSIY